MERPRRADGRAGWRTTVLACLIFALGCGEDGPEPRVEFPDAGALYEVVDVVVRAGEVYDAATQGRRNPFDAVDFAARVVAPSGRVLEVPGFFDGDGRGGRSGDVFRIRLSLDETGDWTFETRSNRARLDGHEGTVRCQGIIDGAFASGPVEIDPEHPRFLQLRDGSPLFLIGKFLDVAAPERIQFSHTFLSEQRDAADRRAMLDRHLAMGANKLNVYLANRGDYGRISVTPWIEEPEQLDPTRWHVYDDGLRQLQEAGLVAHLWFFADDSKFGRLPDADRQRLIRYGMARLSAFPNTMIVLCLEWQEGWSRDQVLEDLAYMRAHNPWDRLVSVHGLTGDFEFPDSDLVDYAPLQPGNDATAEEVYAAMRRSREQTRKPVLAEEFSMGEETDEQRIKTWSAVLAGPAGIGTGAFIAPVAEFVREVPLRGLEPIASASDSPGALALAHPGRRYVFYHPSGGPLRVELEGDGVYATRWFDPRQGGFSPMRWTAAGSRELEPPGPGDWVLVAERRGSGAGVSTVPTE